MRLETGIVEIDLHGKNRQEAMCVVERAVENAGKSVYTIRVIHGFHGGNSLRNMLQEEYSYGRNPKVLEIRGGNNPGITELVLRRLL